MLVVVTQRMHMGDPLVIFQTNKGVPLVIVSI